MFGVMQDITDRKDAQARQEVLTHELEHRIKNILATVSAIASQTLRNTDLETARSNFKERLVALSKAHDILNKTRWTNASMQEVVENAVAAFPEGAISVSGLHLSISPKMALSLALAVNELGTNAMKYGALSTVGGNIKIQWSVDAAEPSKSTGLNWKWTETGGPIVKAPSRRGFGSALIEQVLAADFDGKVQINYFPEGVVCVLSAPIPGISMVFPARN